VHPPLPSTLLPKQPLARPHIAQNFPVRYKTTKILET
jgi:hypothetical protein